MSEAFREGLGHRNGGDDAEHRQDRHEHDEHRHDGVGARVQNVDLSSHLDAAPFRVVVSVVDVEVVGLMPQVSLRDARAPVDGGRLLLGGIAAWTWTNDDFRPGDSPELKMHLDKVKGDLL